MAAALKSIFSFQYYGNNYRAIRTRQVKFGKAYHIIPKSSV